MILKSALVAMLLATVPSISSASVVPALNDEGTVPAVTLAQNNETSRSVELRGGVVQFSGSPEQSTETIPVAEQVVTWNVTKVREGDELFAIAHADLPLEVLRLGNGTVLNAIRDRLMASDFNWDAIRNQVHRISLEEYPGAEYTTIRNGQLTALRLYLVKTDLYALFAQTDDLERAAQYFNSFEPPAVWGQYSSEVGRFTVDLPMAPFIQSETTLFQGEPLSWRHYEAHNLYADPDLFVIAHADIPSADGGDATALLNQVAEGVLTEIGVTSPPESGRTISLEDNPGLEYAGSTRDGTLVFLRFYQVGDRVYAVLGRSQNIENLNQFFSSFQVQ